MMREFIAPVERDTDSLGEPESLRRDALRHGMVAVRGWSGCEADFVELGRRFGLLERSSRSDSPHRGELFRVNSTGDHAVPVGRYWHADGFAHSKSPALLTIYHVAIGASPTSGTAFVDGYLAWNCLDPALKKSLCNRSWTHASGSQHPFVRRHERHCANVLSVNLGRMVAVHGMNEVEFRSTVTSLSQELDLTPCFVHQWREGDVLIVDNRRMLHHAPKIINGERILWRVSVVGYCS